MANSAWTILQTYAINNATKLTLEKDNLSKYHVVIKNETNMLDYFLITDNDLSSAERFFDLIKEAYEERIY